MCSSILLHQKVRKEFAAFDTILAGESEGLPDGSETSWSEDNYISLTRTGFWGTGYTASKLHTNSTLIRFELDGQKLSSRYKIIPVTFFKGCKSLALNKNRHRIEGRGDDFEEYKTKQWYVENEERILMGNKKAIPQFHKYVKAVEYVGDDLPEIVNTWCELNSIPIKKVK